MDEGDYIPLWRRAEIAAEEIILGLTVRQRAEHLYETIRPNYFLGMSGMRRREALISELACLDIALRYN